MAFRRSLTTRASHIARQRFPSFSYAIHDDERKQRSLDEGLPPPKISDFVQQRTFGTGVNNTAGLGAFFQDRRYSHFSHPSGVGSSFCRYMSTTVGDGSGDAEFVKDIAGVFTETVQDVVSQVPAANEVAIAAADSYYHVAALQHLIDYVHCFTGLNWWASIAATTILMRILITPLMIIQLKSTVKLMALRPQMEELSDEIKKKGAMGSLDSQKKLKALYKEHGVSPLTPLRGLLIQVPLFASFFFAISNMAEKVPSFKTGGAFWFTDLSTPDSLYIFPVLTAMTFLIMVECNMQEGMEGTPNAGMMKKVSRVFAALTIPLTMGFPKAIFCYWLTSNMFSVVYGSVIKRPDVKKFLHIPDLPVPAPDSKSKPAFNFFSALKQFSENSKPEAEAPSKSTNQIPSSSSVANRRYKNIEKAVRGKNRRNKRR